MRVTGLVMGATGSIYYTKLNTPFTFVQDAFLPETSRFIVLVAWVLCLDLSTFFTDIQRDYLALTRRVTARHILLPKSDEACLALKQKIRNKAEFIYLVDAFEQAARQYSRDETTNARGGLLGELVPQGYCQIPELDRACFSLRLGIVEGPIESDFGYHLILVTERTNCPKLDGKNTKLVRKKGSKDAILVPSPQVGQVDIEFAAGQVAFWMFCLFTGGIVAELAAQVGTGIGMKM